MDVFVCDPRRKLARVGAPGVIAAVRGHGHIAREPAEAPASRPALPRIGRGGAHLARSGWSASAAAGARTSGAMAA